MEKVILKADIREELGKEANRKLRAQGLIPGVVYKKGSKALSLKVDTKKFFNILHTSAGENVIITLQIKEKEDKTVIIKEIQYDPVREDMFHVDFHEISLTEKITVNIPIEPKGEPEGVKTDGGILDHPLKELEIECLPTQIPERIDVRVENLKIGDAIRVKDLDIPEGITVLNDPEITVLSVVPPRVEEEPEEGLEEAAGEPEVIREKKPEGEEEGELKEKEEASKEEKKEKKKE